MSPNLSLHLSSSYVLLCPRCLVVPNLLGTLLPRQAVQAPPLGEGSQAGRRVCRVPGLGLDLGLGPVNVTPTSAECSQSLRSAPLLPGT